MEKEILAGNRLTDSNPGGGATNIYQSSLPVGAHTIKAPLYYSHKALSLPKWVYSEGRFLVNQTIYMYTVCQTIGLCIDHNFSLTLLVREW